jgi:serine/threonine-protein kinase
MGAINLVKKPSGLKPRQTIGKYRIERRIARGGFADVYQALDTIEGIRVALKVPHDSFLHIHGEEGFRQEVRVNARLSHPNILPVKNADFIDGRFIIAYPLGERSLADRLKSRVATRTAIDYADQILAAVAHAHERRLIHCDIKPENFVLFDRGIARYSVRTMLNGSGSGTVGYLAPEQAMGQLSFRSDVFSVGLVLYRMFSGRLPQWPYEWPLPGHAVLKRKLHPDMIALIQRAVLVDAKRRFESAVTMRNAFLRMRPRVLASVAKRRRRTSVRQNWEAVRLRSFRREYGRVLGLKHECTSCGGPLAESMKTCPWCGKDHAKFRDESSFPAVCPRCNRGVKLDWKFCAWCYGSTIGPLSDREYSDRRYSAKCSGAGCERRDQLPFTCYCPWCRRKATKKWKIPGERSTCRKCGWGVVKDHWNFCPWCSTTI